MKNGKTLPGWALALVQSTLAAVFVLAACFAVYSLHSRFAIASLAASAFIAFGFPSAESARPRYLVGGYVCGTVCGVLCCFARQLFFPGFSSSYPVLISFSALAVFFTCLSMILLNLQHPPSCALAVGMVLEPDPLLMGLAMLGCMVLLCLVRWAALKLFGRYFPSR